ncbi:hypothetical protein GLOIN_2v1768118 [Rhizophagus clarus]|uniref:Uncharacterized protein n=1 Tax=Rhizophagus clarus TaxID=94130 RepID=A0A8H3KVU2_9GLOM|nr:hypothetical protein GLOIN_2v1768118 [Rhizophagus clarus]
MPAKISTICYLHDFTEWLTQEFTVKEITAVARLDDNDPTKIVYLRVKAFILVNATSIKTINNIEFDDMPVIGLNIMILGITTKTVRNVDSQSIIDFYVKENLGDQELEEFWVEGPVLDETTDDEISPRKHILILDDISLISTNCNPAANPHQSSNVP